MVSLVLGSFPSSQNPFPVFSPIKSPLSPSGLARTLGFQLTDLKWMVLWKVKKMGKKSLFCVYTLV